MQTFTRNPRKCFPVLAFIPLSTVTLIMKQSFAILSEKLLDRLLEVDTQKHRYKSGLTPPAQTPKLLQLQSRPECQVNISEAVTSRIQTQNPRLFYLIEFMSASGCRISEALAVKANNITSTGHVKIKALKGSVDRIVSSGMATKFMQDCKTKNISPWADWSRHFVYREFKKIGVSMSLPGKSRKAVTHAFRHQLAKSIQSANMQITDTQKALGHKSINSTKHYHGNKSEWQ